MLKPAKSSAVITAAYEEAATVPSGPLKNVTYGCDDSERASLGDCET